MARTALVLDLGSCSLTAVTRDAAGHVKVVRVGDRDVSDAWLVVDDDLQPRPPRADDPENLAHLGSLLARVHAGPKILGDTAWPFPALLQILLAPVLAAARTEIGEPEDIVVVAPAAWPDRDTRALQRAMHSALERPVTLVPSDKALAFTVPTPGREVLVVDAGASTLSAVVVAASQRGPRIAHRATVEVGGDAFDRILLADAVTAAGFEEFALDTRWAWVGVPRVRVARMQLAEVDPVTVRLPAPVHRIVLSGTEVDTTGAQFFRSQLAELFAGIEQRQVERVLLCGGLALDPALVDIARELLTGQVQVASSPTHVLCRGALRYLDTGIDSTGDPAPARVPARAPRARTAPSATRRNRYIASGAVAALTVTAGVLVWRPSSPVPQWSDAEVRQAALAVLPQTTSLADLYIKRWSTGGADTDTLVRTPATAMALSCGGDRVMTESEPDTVRLQTGRVFLASPAAATPSDPAQFDWAHAGPSVIASVTVLDAADADTVWRNLEHANRTCPNTAATVVRHVVPVPLDGTDPGPPTYARDDTAALLRPTTTPASAPGTSVVPAGGVAVGRDRMGWRGLISATQTGTTAGLNVTCIAARDSALIRRVCATSRESGDADRSAAAAIQAFNPIPAELR